MAVLIRDMEMPEKCDECFARHAGLAYCQIARTSTSHTSGGKPISQHTRPTWCPLVELPPKHGRLIDGDAVIANRFKNPISYNAFKNLIKRQMTVIKAEDEG